VTIIVGVRSTKTTPEAFQEQNMITFVSYTYPTYTHYVGRRSTPVFGNWSAVLAASASVLAIVAAYMVISSL
jgi:hypothetical protein